MSEQKTEKCSPSLLWPAHTGVYLSAHPMRRLVLVPKAPQSTCALVPPPPPTSSPEEPPVHSTVDSRMLTLDLEYQDSKVHFFQLLPV